ncbi:MAG: hypothetical protein RDU14_06190 [Melioribacteraceae bacterium]|nr:hypothetical protein [Melioribacteraceae bacterium]
MQNNVKITCTMFKHDMWLYLDRALPDEKMEFWRSHLQRCDYCRDNLKSTEEIISASSSNLLFDLDDNIFDNMVERAVRKKRFDIVRWIPQKRIREVYTIGKIAFASILVIAAVVVSLLSDKPNTIKSVSKELLDWDGKEIRSELNKIGSRIELIRNDNMEGWSREVNILDNRLNILEIQGDPDSFY